MFAEHHYPTSSLEALGMQDNPLKFVESGKEIVLEAPDTEALRIYLEWLVGEDVVDETNVLRLFEVADKYLGIDKLVDFFVKMESWTLEDLKRLETLNPELVNIIRTCCQKNSDGLLALKRLFEIEEDHNSVNNGLTGKDVWQAREEYVAGGYEEILDGGRFGAKIRATGFNLALALGFLSIPFAGILGAYIGLLCILLPLAVMVTITILSAVIQGVFSLYRSRKVTSIVNNSVLLNQQAIKAAMKFDKKYFPKMITKMDLRQLLHFRRILGADKFSRIAAEFCPNTQFVKLIEFASIENVDVLLSRISTDNVFKEYMRGRYFREVFQRVLERHAADIRIRNFICAYGLRQAA